MHVQFSTDSNIKGTEAVAEQAEAMLRETLGHLSEHVSRIEVHLSEVGSDDKGSPAETRCMLEARPNGRQPIAVDHQGGNVVQAVDGAADKLKRSLESLLGRLAER